MKKIGKKCITLALLCTVSWLILRIYKTNNFDLLVGTNELTSNFYSQSRIPIFTVSKEMPNSQRFVHKELTKGKGISNKILYKGINISTEFEYFYRNMSEDNLDDPLLHKHQYRSLLNNDIKCKGKSVFMLVFVHSSEDNFLERQLIRSTYGSISDYENEHIEYIFVLGQTPNTRIQQKINDESEKYMDIVQECHMLTKTKPIRHKSKWKTSLLEYPFPTFPPYCKGYSSIMSIDVIRKMYDTTKEVPFLWLEDVYGGGFLPWISNIEMHQPYCYWTYVVNGNMHGKECTLFYLSYSSNNILQKDIWEQISKQINVSCKC
ncbi:unnamed protein product [Mytilus coruscus]|uniref:Hexosyltransferase n=1 Tax=Mytilus coruscus TaxID=42192 RepID=A0A6J8D5H3_MYTCO|nr:unnamed protein product [Mytilus coruscus]